MRCGELLGSGRTADVYALGRGRVLRRYRNGADARPEAELMARLAALGYPVPAVHPATAEGMTSADLVLERLTGPTMLEALLAGEESPERAGAVLGRLLNRLHALPGRHLHLDLHPGNVLLTPRGPVVIDWANAEVGPGGLDDAMSAVILAEVGVGEGPFAGPVRAILSALLAAVAAVPTREELDEAVARRAANPTLSEAEVNNLAAALALVRRNLKFRSET
ncbi:phosphotransferase [Streptomyces hoynatensis]|uniref:Aminoglycoside phosphotransferase family protein n=1 Tax=Streptomyces hoynatensis TaxID=1141874 RepID=A0A3A9YPS2_9ACTN|nr:phosphotransferase [Streptomyces hoynatensis]RKN37980.1 aminoglycoside phosphotransferase family protein [Streptomyces hoynatensis]